MSDLVTQEKNCQTRSKPFAAAMTKLLGHFPAPEAKFRQQAQECPSCKEVYSVKMEATSA